MPPRTASPFDASPVPEFMPDLGSAGAQLAQMAQLFQVTRAQNMQFALAQSAQQAEQRSQNFKEVLAMQEMEAERRRDEQQAALQGLRTAAEMQSMRIQAEAASFAIQKSKDEWEERKSALDATKALAPAQTAMEAAVAAQDYLGAALHGDEIMASKELAQQTQEQRAIFATAYGKTMDTRLVTGTVREKLNTLRSATGPKRILAAAELSAFATPGSVDRLKATLGMTEEEWSEVVEKQPLFTPEARARDAEFRDNYGKSFDPLIAEAILAKDFAGAEQLRAEKESARAAFVLGDPTASVADPKRSVVGLQKQLDSMREKMEFALEKGGRKAVQDADGRVRVGTAGESMRDRLGDVAAGVFAGPLGWVGVDVKETLEQGLLLKQYRTDAHNLTALLTAIKEKNYSISKDEVARGMLAYTRMQDLAASPSMRKQGVQPLSLGDFVSPQEMRLFMMQLDRRQASEQVLLGTAPRVNAPSLFAPGETAYVKTAQGIFQVDLATGARTPAQ